MYICMYTYLYSFNIARVERKFPEAETLSENHI